ncbi:MAG: helicase C-terminal domain-containing protein [Candidatus Didemnitutus sp.]|nr:helicase C-terminal domain-containing protein [Candidatus Didemnitutus sp.]
MQFSLPDHTASLSVGDFAEFALGPKEGGGGSPGLWRAQLGQHWHSELRRQVEHEQATQSAPSPAAFEIPIEGQLTLRGWTLFLSGRIDQQVGTTLREIKTVLRPLPIDEAELRADYGSYFLQLATYVVLRRLQGAPATRAALIFVEADSGLAQTIALTPFDEALVHHQLEAVVQFLELQQRAAARRRTLHFRSPFATLRAGQETIQTELGAALDANPVVFFEAPTGYGKTGCVLELALQSLQTGRFDRVVWLSSKSTGQLQVIETLRRMTDADGTSATRGEATTPVAYWQVRNKREHCVNAEFHCVRGSCDYLAGAVERWPQSGLDRFYRDDRTARALEQLRAAGREARICPYEITRAALAFNDVWIGDFNYVFAPANRGIFFDQPGFDPSRTLLVIDEAHNLPARVADAYSATASTAALHGLLAELDHGQAPPMLVLAVEAWARLLGAVQPCDELNGADEADLHDALTQLVERVALTPLDYAALGPVHSETLWSFGKLAESWRDENLRRLLWSRRPGTLEFTCLDASAAISATLRSFGGAILLSATLSPFDQFAAACAQTTYSPLRAIAPWRTKAYDVAVDLRLSTAFRERDRHYGTTAETIAAMHRAARKTVAVFFPSYAYAEAVLQPLERTQPGLRAALQPKQLDLAQQAAWVEESLALADALFLVLGSSFAESIDLLGGRIDHAVVVGPALPEVNAVQRARSATYRDLGPELAFRRVYQIPGLQKVNQALGRLVRAPGHRARVLLHCRRFAESSYASLLDPDCQHYVEVATHAEFADWLAGA